MNLKVLPDEQTKLDSICTPKVELDLFRRQDKYRFPNWDKLEGEWIYFICNFSLLCILYRTWVEYCSDIVKMGSRLGGIYRTKHVM